jgi:hypothetical protein
MVSHQEKDTEWRAERRHCPAIPYYPSAAVFLKDEVTEWNGEKQSKLSSSPFLDL